MYAHTVGVLASAVQPQPAPCSSNCCSQSSCKAGDNCTAPLAARSDRNTCASCHSITLRLLTTRSHSSHQCPSIILHQALLATALQYQDYIRACSPAPPKGGGATCDRWQAGEWQRLNVSSTLESNMIVRVGGYVIPIPAYWSDSASHHDFCCMPAGLRHAAGWQHW
jgi:hypothetical protein